MFDTESMNNWWKWAEIEKDGLIEVNYLRFDGNKYYRTETEFWLKCPEISPGFLKGQHLITIGVNPRPVLEDNNLRGCAHDKDIQIYKNIYIDIEPIHEKNTNVTEEELQKCREFVANLEGLGDYFSVRIDGDRIWAESGNGVHILIAIPPYDKPQEFGNKLQTWYKTVLLPETDNMRKQYNCRIDSTFSPSRQVKLYGTRKPIENSRISTFPGVERIESADFRDYILSFSEKKQTQVSVDCNLRTTLTVEEIEKKYGLK